MLFNKEQLTHIIMRADKCLNPGLDDQTLTANILITVSPNVSQKHSISKHDSPIISMVLSISWWPIANGRIWGGKCVKEVILKAKILLVLKIQGLCEANHPDPV